jgi:hypothetical protein
MLGRVSPCYCREFESNSTTNISWDVPFLSLCRFVSLSRIYPTELHTQLAHNSLLELLVSAAVGRGPLSLLVGNTFWNSSYWLIGSTQVGLKETSKTCPTDFLKSKRNLLTATPGIIIEYRLRDTHSLHSTMTAVTLLTSVFSLSWTCNPSNFVLSILLLLLWRLWKFSLKPYLYPDDPKELPYWIPCRSSTISVQTDANIFDAKQILAMDGAFSQA